MVRGLQVAGPRLCLNFRKSHAVSSSIFLKCTSSLVLCLEKKRHDLGVLKLTTLKLLQGVITLLILMQLTVSHKSTWVLSRISKTTCTCAGKAQCERQIQSSQSFLVSFELKWSIFLRFPIKQTIPLHSLLGKGNLQLNFVPFLSFFHMKFLYFVATSRLANDSFSRRIFRHVLPPSFKVLFVSC